MFTVSLIVYWKWITLHLSFSRFFSSKHFSIKAKFVCNQHSFCGHILSPKLWIWAAPLDLQKAVGMQPFEAVSHSFNFFAWCIEQCFMRMLHYFDEFCVTLMRKSSEGMNTLRTQTKRLTCSRNFAWPPTTICKCNMEISQKQFQLCNQP